MGTKTPTSAPTKTPTSAPTKAPTTEPTTEPTTAVPTTATPTTQCEVDEDPECMANRLLITHRPSICGKCFLKQHVYKYKPMASSALPHATKLVTDAPRRLPLCQQTSRI